jgi:hypothetical protein
LKHAVQHNKLIPLRQFIKFDQGQYERQADLCYGEGRYLMMYLYSKGLLRKWYDAYVAGYKDDPTGGKAIEVVLGKNLDDVEKDFVAYVTALKSVPTWSTKGQPGANTSPTGEQEPPPAQTAGKKHGDAPAPRSTTPELSMPERFQKYSALSQELPKAAAAKDSAKLLDLLQQQVALVGKSGFDHGHANFNLACILARMGRKDDAIKALNLAVDQGFTDADRMKNANNLKSLRRDKRFTAVLKRADPDADDETSEPASSPEKKRGILGVAVDDGAIIQRVGPDSAAEKAGLKPDDAIVRIDDQPIKQRADLVAILSKKAAGDKIRVTFTRDNKQQTVDVVLAEPPADADIAPPQPPKKATPPKGPSPSGADRSPSSNHSQRKAAPLDKAASLKAGMKWLASQQLEDGSFPASDEFGPIMQFTVAISALSGMALMTDEQYRPQVEKTLNFILANVHKDGYIYGGRGPSFKGMWEHGFATQFLAEALLHMQRQGKDVSAILPKLQVASDLIRRAQNIEGGWGYRARPDPHAEVGPAAAQLDALLLARQAGIEVDQPCIGRGLHSQTALLVPPAEHSTFQGEWRSYSYEAKAFVLESLMGWKDRPETKAYLAALHEVTPGDYFQTYTEQTPVPGAYWSSGYHTLGLYYTAVAYRRLGKPYREQFDRWHRQVCQDLAQRQNPQGSWKGWFGDAFGTALACLTLAADGNALAAFSSSDLEAAPAAPPTANAKTLAFGRDGEISLSYTVRSAKTGNRSPSVSELVRDIGLKRKAQQTWPLQDLSPLAPSKPVTVGSTWPVSHDFVQKFFAPFHPTARGTMECCLFQRTGGRAYVGLTALVKFGADDAKLIQTTCMEGQFELDEGKGTIEAFDLFTVSGCSAFKSGGAGGVSLNDAEFRIRRAPAQVY